LRFAFHHFDTDNEGYITKNDLKEVFKRSGQNLTDNDLNTIIKQAKEPYEDDTFFAE
jgi:Ca2+-binding EF-hand superfamily protein